MELFCRRDSCALCWTLVLHWPHYRDSKGNTCKQQVSTPSGSPLAAPPGVTGLSGWGDSHPLIFTATFHKPRALPRWSESVSEGSEPSGTATGAPENTCPLVLAKPLAPQVAPRMRGTGCSLMQGKPWADHPHPHWLGVPGQGDVSQCF